MIVVKKQTVYSDCSKKKKNEKKMKENHSEWPKLVSTVARVKAD